MGVGYAEVNSMRAAIYLRISDDRTGLEAGVRRQRDDCLSYCSRMGFEVVEVYTDNDRSAYSGKKRPAYEAMLERVTAGGVDAIVAWHMDRLYRRPKELEALIELAESMQVHTPNGDINLATGDGRFLARILVSVAAKSSDDASRRIRRQKAERRAQGLYNGSPRPFGWEPRMGGVREEEAGLIRSAATEVLAGGSLRGIAHRWSRLGVPTPQHAKEWDLTTVRKILLAERHVPAILSPETHKRLTVMLSTRRRASERGFGLLTGVLTCGRCEGNMVRGVTGVHNKPAYRCRGCQVSIQLAPLEEFVEHRVRGRIAKGGTVPDVEDEGQESLLVDQADLERLAVDYADRLITREQFLTATSRIKERMARTAKPIRPTITGSYDDLPPASRRTFIASIVESIVVAPAGPSRPRLFDKDRVTITWR